MTIPKPRWFRTDTVMVSTAPTCGISKSGQRLVKFDPATGTRIEEPDPETVELVEAIDDQLLADMEALRDNGQTDTLRFVPRSQVSTRLAVPVYYDRRFHDAFAQPMQQPEFEGFTTATLGQLQQDGQLEIRHGHGSAPKDLRVGEVPYIKVSDLRAGLVNINPTNRVPLSWAENMWDDTTSGLKAFDLICPERVSKNIGDFYVLLPGQEQILITKEVIILRPGSFADFDPFYLLWAMTLKIVRNQWQRVVFMQTNREDVGGRYLEIEIPLAASPERATEVSQPFREYFTAIATARDQLRTYLDKNGEHHFFVSGGEQPPEDQELTLDVPADELGE